MKNISADISRIIGAIINRTGEGLRFLEEFVSLSVVAVPVVAVGGISKESIGSDINRC
jgi:thiamine monophosphate synthase